MHNYNKYNNNNGNVTAITSTAVKFIVRHVVNICKDYWLQVVYSCLWKTHYTATDLPN